MFSKKFFAILFACTLALCSGSLTAAPVIKNSDRVAFLGDSITRAGVWSAGFIHLIQDVFKANGIDAKVIPAGISGHKSNDMLKRLKKDVLDKKATIMTLSCGVNDVWHGKKGVPLNEYKKNITAIIDNAQKSGVKVYVLTATMIREVPNNELNRQLIPYNDFLRKIAREKNCVLVDMNKIMHDELVATHKKYPGVKGNVVTYDGVHMDVLGNIMMAKSLLRAFGFSDAQIAKAESAWMRRNYSITRAVVRVDEYIKLSEKAFAAKMDVPSYINKLIRDDLKK